MILFLFTTSFLIHIITIVFLFILYKLYKEDRAKVSQHHQEIAPLFDTYLEEIKKENKHLLSKIQTPTHCELPTKTEKELDKSYMSMDNDSLYKKSFMNDQMETSIHAQVLQLYDQGLAVEEIAKKLDCGKTEASLIIKFYAKKQG